MSCLCPTGGPGANSKVAWCPQYPTCPWCFCPRAWLKPAHNSKSSLCKATGPSMRCTCRTHTVMYNDARRVIGTRVTRAEGNELACSHDLNTPPTQQQRLHKPPSPLQKPSTVTPAQTAWALWPHAVQTPCWPLTCSSAAKAPKAPSRSQPARSQHDRAQRHSGNNNTR
jgi:hypothetical protein